MNTSKELDILHSGKVELGSNYLTLADNVTDEELPLIFEALKRCSDSTKFWIGDYALAVDARIMSKELKNLSKVERAEIEALPTEELKREHRKFKDIISKQNLFYEIVKQTGYEPKTVQNIKSVCKALPKEKRVNLSFDYHAEVIGAYQKNPEEAVKLLKYAAENKIPQKEFRTYYRSIASGKDFVADAVEVVQKPTNRDEKMYQVIDAINVLTRYLNAIRDTELAVKKTYLRMMLEPLFELAKKKLN